MQPDRHYKILMVHNFYRDHGGEDEVFAAEKKLLESAGHTVATVTAANDDLNTWSQIRRAATAIWSGESLARVRQEIRRFRPDVMHVHNTFAALSPSIYHAAFREDVPVVQTLHNYRLACLNALFLRNGKPCELCLGKSMPWPGIRHRCYRDSAPASMAVASMLTLHRGLGTYTRLVDRFIALTEFARQKFITAGLPAGSIEVKGNFVFDAGAYSASPGRYALYAGRLAPEKGIAALLDAWRMLPENLPLKIAGTGPMLSMVKQACLEMPWIEHKGQVPREELLRLMRDAAFLVVPSICYEAFGSVVVESFSTGTPVLASNLGSLAEIVEPESTGFLFESGSAESLANAVSRFLSSPESLHSLRSNCRQRYLELHTPQVSLKKLEGIYARVVRPKAATTADLVSPQ